jgi:signal transduction histidine kinase
MRRHSWALPVCVGALVGLLVLLGTLQYRWLGQVSETIAAQKRASLLRRGQALVGAVEREITRAYLWFRPDESWPEGAAGESLAERWRSWREAGRHAALVKDVLVVRRQPDEPPMLERVDRASGSLVAASWEPLAEVREELAARGGFGPAPPLRELRTGPVLLVRSERPERSGGAPGLMVLVLIDEDHLLSALLPQLAEEHLSPGDDGVGIIAQLRRGNRSGWSWPAQGLFRGAGDHAPIPVFGVRPDLVDRSLLAGIRPQPTRPLDGGAGPFRFRGPGRGFPVPPPPGAGPGSGRGPRPRPPPPTAWSLSLGYAAGPVDALVTSLRRRNLAVSFGILAVLGGAIAVLALAFRRAQSLAERHQEFLASMSHELRTPLAVIAAAAENLRDGAVDEPPRVREYGSLIRDESKRLTTMVDDVLRLAGESAAGLRLSPVDLGVLVRAVIESLQPEVRARGGRIDFIEPERPVVVTADPQALRQAFDNLLGNALKYGGTSPLVTVRISRVNAPAGPEVKIAVTDRGIGIPADELPHIFEPFFRGKEAAAQQIRGTGLGLSLVWRVMKAHGGSVTVESTPGRGSCFMLSLPAVTDQGPAV